MSLWTNLNELEASRRTAESLMTALQRMHDG